MIMMILVGGVYLSQALRPSLGLHENTINFKLNIQTSFSYSPLTMSCKPLSGCERSLSHKLSADFFNHLSDEGKTFHRKQSIDFHFIVKNIRKI